MARLKFGDKCPAYDSVTCGPNKYRDYCEDCLGCKARFIDGVECGYSPTPTTVPKYKEGKYLYKFFHLDSYEKAKVRALRWRMFEWEYVFGRERTWYGEHEVYETQKEIDEVVINRNAQRLLQNLQDYSEKYHIPLEVVKRKMLE